jgi:hypothetical protein
MCGEGRRGQGLLLRNTSDGAHGPRRRFRGLALRVLSLCGESHRAQGALLRGGIS